MWLVLVHIVVSKVKLIHLYRTTSFMPRNTLLTNAEVLQEKPYLAVFQYSIYSKDWYMLEKTSTGQNHNDYVDLVLQTI